LTIFRSALSWVKILLPFLVRACSISNRFLFHPADFSLYRLDIEQALKNGQANNIAYLEEYMNSKDRNERLKNNLQTVIQDAETLLKDSILPDSENFKSAKKRFETTIQQAKDEIERLEGVVVDKAKEIAHTTDNYVKENPWQTMGLGVLFGAAITALIMNRK
jgi:ElaB/YqjD/DUF883 family membrane-anchored ribosome-binding protein